MPNVMKIIRPIPGTPAARRNPVTVLVESVRGGHSWSHSFMPVIAEDARRRGWRLLNTVVMRSGGLPKVPLHGALVQSLPDGELVKALEKRVVPAVRLGRFRHPRDAGLPAILPDLEAQGAWPPSISPSAGSATSDTWVMRKRNMTDR